MHFNQQPRMVSARVASRAVIASIDSTLLDVLLTFDQSATPRAVSLGTALDDDWLTRMFRSEAFVKIPPGDIQDKIGDRPRFRPPNPSRAACRIPRRRLA